MPEERANDVEQLARILSELETQEVKQRTKGRMEREWQGKKTTTKPQREPEGLFAQEQARLL